jgi:hypothetical protein
LAATGAYLPSGFIAPCRRKARRGVAGLIYNLLKY